MRTPLLFGVGDDTKYFLSLSLKMTKIYRFKGVKSRRLPYSGEIFCLLHDCFMGEMLRILSFMDFIL